MASGFGMSAWGGERGSGRAAPRPVAGPAAGPDDLRRLRGLVAQMGGLAEEAIARAMTALGRGDGDLAGAVLAADGKVDALAAEVERGAVAVLSAGPPAGPELREAVAALKIAAMIERIADYAKNIAKRVPMVAADARPRPLDALAAMGRIAGEMVRDALDAFSARDPVRAGQVCRRDEALDEVHAGVFRALVAHMAAHPETVEGAAHLLFVAKNLERIGDHATNLAEMVHFAATGEHPAERRRGAAAG